MYVERIRVGKLDIQQSYKRGQLLLETVKMRGLNEFNLKEGKKGDVPSTSSDLSLDDKTAIRFMTQETKRFDYSIQVNNVEGAEQNHFKDKEMNGIQSEEMNNISLSLCHLFNTKTTQEKTPENQKNTPAKKSESDFKFLKPKVYQCYYCRRVFFNTATYRRHMIRQLKKLHWCSICKRGFVSKLWFRKHRLFCFLS